MTVIGVPVLNRPDLLTALLRSVDEDWPVVVIDNSDGPEIAQACEPFRVSLVMPPANLGVAASWNLVIRTHPEADWWCLANADTILGAGDLRKLAAVMTEPGPRWVGMNGDWRVFGLNREAVEVVGLFDENYYPVYVEDADYERRCTLAGVPWFFIDGGAVHVGSAAYRSEQRYGDANARTYPANVAYFERKWGGPVRSGRFTSPFDQGGSVRDWTLDLARLRAQAWP